MTPGGPCDQVGLGYGGAGGSGSAAELGLLERKPREQSGLPRLGLDSGAGRSEDCHAAAFAHTLLTPPLPLNACDYFWDGSQALWNIWQ